MMPAIRRFHGNMESEKVSGSCGAVVEMLKAGGPSLRLSCQRNGCSLVKSFKGMEDPLFPN